MGIFEQIERWWLDPETTTERIQGLIGKLTIEGSIAVVLGSILLILVMSIFYQFPEYHFLSWSRIVWEVAIFIYGSVGYSVYCTVISADADPYGFHGEDEKEESGEDAEQTNIDEFDS